MDKNTKENTEDRVALARSEVWATMRAYARFAGTQADECDLAEIDALIAIVREQVRAEVEGMQTYKMGMGGVVLVERSEVLAALADGTTEGK